MKGLQLATSGTTIHSNLEKLKKKLIFFYCVSNTICCKNTYYSKSKMHISPTACQRTVTERGQERHPSFQLRAETLQEIFHVCKWHWASMDVIKQPFAKILNQQRAFHILYSFKWRFSWYNLQVSPSTHLRGEISAAECYDWVLPYCPPRWVSCPPKRSHLTLPEPFWRTAQSPDSPPLAEDLPGKDNSM